MLDRIVNIEPGFNFKRQQPKSPQFDKLFSNVLEGKQTSGDKANLSPAATFLQKMHWQLLKMKQRGPEKVELRFIVDELEFETEMEVSIQNQGRQKFYVYDHFVDEGKRLRCGIQYSLEKRSPSDVSNYEIMPLNTTKLFFDRAVSDSLHHDLPFASYPEVNWYENLVPQLKSELENIYTGALAFVEKVLQAPTSKLKQVNQTTQSIDLERFTIEEI